MARDPELVGDTSLIDFSRGTAADLAFSERREWLVTNGIGGYASGTVSGILTRRYHGVLVAALTPPLGRTLLVTKFDETVSYLGRDTALFANRWLSGAVDPQGFAQLERFRLDGTTPVWTYAIADALIEKRLFMAPGENTTYVRYRALRASAPIELTIKALVNHRDHHGETHAGDWRMTIAPVQRGLSVVAWDGAAPFYVLSDGATAEPAHDWYHDYRLAQEAYRGFEAIEDHLHAGTLRATLAEGASVTVVATTDASRLAGDATRLGADADAAWNVRLAHERTLIASAGNPDDAAVRQLVLAADQFVVRRATPDDPQGATVMAGYHWFSDWGRDTMIALPGLLLETGRTDLAATVLRTFARFVDRGMLPNRFPDGDEAPEYNTVDATLWYFEAIRAYVEATGDEKLLAELYPLLEDILNWHQRGTRYGIRVDDGDGLLAAGEPGVQLTWMDAKVGDHVITPRIGKPVEINALWYNALSTMAGFARRLGRSAQPFADQALRVAASFERFWNAGAGYLFDVLDGPAGNDAALRPNQLYAVALPFSPLDAARQRAVVDVCQQRLLTPHGLRSLDGDDPQYVGVYGGSPQSRDGAYHQGTVWAFLIGPFVAAHLRVHGDRATARSFIVPLLRHLADHGLGSVSEIFDGDAPHTPRGCIAQAWSVAEVLRAWKMTGEAAGTPER